MKDDIDRIMELMEAAFDPVWGEAWNRKQVESSLVTPTTFYRLLAKDGNDVLPGEDAGAFAMVRAAPGEEELLLIAVHPGLRGQGLGGLLLELLVMDARARGAERMFLEMRANNPAQSLYEAHDFIRIGERRDYYTRSDGSKLDAITFARTL